MIRCRWSPSMLIDLTSVLKFKILVLVVTWGLPFLNINIWEIDLNVVRINITLIPPSLLQHYRLWGSINSKLRENLKFMPTFSFIHTITNSVLHYAMQWFQLRAFYLDLYWLCLWSFPIATTLFSAIASFLQEQDSQRISVHHMHEDANIGQKRALVLLS